MLNISSNKISQNVEAHKFSALSKAQNRKTGRVFIRLVIALTLVAIIILFLPWTQNIQSQGSVIALKPDQRPQSIHSVISGRIEKWYVQEGQHVEKGDTILFISEVKDDYFDPNLVNNTKTQLEYKEQGLTSYDDKVNALENQIEALRLTSKLKLEQTKNKLRQAELKVSSDSIDFNAASANYKTAQDQYERTKELYQQGLKSLTELENRNLAVQKTKSDMISAENKWLTSKNEAINAQVEFFSIQAQYEYEISKTESDKNTALSNKFDASAQVTKLENQYQNYLIRNNLYYITAPQSGYITKAIQSGLGEVIKEGTPIVTIMPSHYDLAVEMFVDPIDLPLIQKGQDVRIQFDGWPSIVFSGWPNASYGTFGGKVYAIDNFISDNGKYRVLVTPDPKDHPWPEALRVGAGTANMLLLKDVPIWYEMWRKINGFPPDYYKKQNALTKSEKKQE
ncbi:MAG: HlyD family efflux transporter periplasmic adaptor subunit [Crocinitomicaceae bacterium]|jgi:adhesin transport system membrane fusion protein|nr:HlyD family efflux transporter periplasmic adaptor subunit [Crocinitomicaceae bacterium]MBK9592656.1 HlyD family efflux transporter periplasmic adaptor subunit [Crocinitomicaceae bacterium]